MMTNRKNEAGKASVNAYSARSVARTLQAFTHRWGGALPRDLDEAEGHDGWDNGRPSKTNPPTAPHPLPGARGSD
jgi:hypothetical protein